jgi:DNA modification methylase
VSWEIRHGNCLEVMRTMPAESVHCVVTSPPYWGLRDYGIEPSTWPDGWVGCFGLEPTPEMYVAHAVLIFREVRRVLRSDGTLWLNIGDSYASNGGHSDTTCNDRRGEYNIGRRPEHENRQFRARGGKDCDPKRGTAAEGQPYRACAGLKPKDLVMMPARVAMALQADGWYLRSQIIWHKNNPMPESVTDRPTKSHEYIYLLAKSQRYFYDAEAIKEDTSGTAHSRGDGVNPKAKATGKNSRQCVDRDPSHLGMRNNGVGWGYADDKPKPRAKQNESFSGAVNQLVPRRNKRDVWTVATAPFAEAHFATFPPALIEPCILAGTSEKCCAACFAPYERIVTKVPTGEEHRLPAGMATHEGGHGSIHKDGREQEVTTYEVMETRTIGWDPTCKCDAHREIVSCTVLDPFNGAGTTGMVARGFQRSYIGIELNPSYIDMAKRRIGMVARGFQRSYIGIELNPSYIDMAKRRIIGDAPLFNTPEASA